MIHGKLFGRIFIYFFSVSFLPFYVDRGVLIATALRFVAVPPCGRLAYISFGQQNDYFPVSAVKLNF